MKLRMNSLTLVQFISMLIVLVSCSLGDKPEFKQKSTSDFMYGADLSILKRMNDLGGKYKMDGVEKDALEIFTENGYNYGRLRIFHTPNMQGPVCNSLDYTIALAKDIKGAGMKLLLDFHYSDTWADPAHQHTPKAWEGLTLEVLTDSVYHYTRNVVEAMDKAGVLPDMVQVGNEITPGMMWEQGRIYKKSGEDWESFCHLLNAGIGGVNDAYGDTEVPIMIHIDKGGDLNATNRFFTKIEEHGVEYDVIGLSYYPWWHGTFSDLQKNLKWVSDNKEQDIVIVETAYYSNGYYPKPGKWVLDYQPYPATEQGQYDFLVALDSIARQYPKVKGIFYWKPDGLEIVESGVHYLGRSLFDKNGNAFMGIKAFKK